FTVTGLYPALRSSLIVLGFCSTTVAPSFVGLRQETRNLVSGEVRKATPLVLALHYNHNLSPRRHGWLTFPDERTDAAARHSGALEVFSGYTETGEPSGALAGQEAGAFDRDALCQEQGIARPAAVWAHEPVAFHLPKHCADCERVVKARANFRVPAHKLDFQRIARLDQLPEDRFRQLAFGMFG